MIAHAYVKQPGGITREQWEAFCAEHNVAYTGLNVYHLGGKTGIECVFGNGESAPPDVADHVQLSTSWGGPRKRDLARLAAALWTRFGGSLYADEDTRRLICGDGQSGEGRDERGRAGMGGRSSAT